MYELDSKGFNKVVEHGSKIDFSDLKIVQWSFSDSAEIPVTEDMITGDYSTSTVGRKNIIIEMINIYKGEDDVKMVKIS